MSQTTQVVLVPRKEFASLKARLEAGPFEWRRVPHAAFSVKGDGAVATLYSSGKLVVQSSDPAAFLARWTGYDAPAPAPSASSGEAHDKISRTDEPTVGSDETGKGDYFGPLVVAAVRLEPAQAKGILAAGVMDSKKLTDERALRLAVALRELPHAIEVLTPDEYNIVYPRYKGLNPLLADLHAKAIGKVARDGDRVLVDQFANERVMREATSHLKVKLEQAHRAERNAAVAAASILARAEFLLRLRELSERYEVELRKGAGAPTDKAALQFAHQHGRDALGEVAKLHFKNTLKLEARL